MKHFVIVLLMLGILGSSLPAEAQFDGPVPVVDIEANAVSWPLQLARMLTEIRILQRQLEDMLLQGRKGPTGSAGAIGALLNELAEIELGDSILYGHSGSEIWTEVYKYDEVFPHGGWLEESLMRGRRAMNTGRSIMRQLERARQAEIDDEGSLVSIMGAISSAIGRNEFLPAIGTAGALSANLERKTYQGIMTVANQLAVTNAQQVNEQVSREAQARYFLDPPGRQVEFPEFIDRGL